MALRLVLCLLLLSSILGCESATSGNSAISVDQPTGGLPGVLTRAGAVVSEEDCPAGGVEIVVGIDATSQARSPHKTSLSTLINRERLQFLSKDFKTKGSITIEDRKKYGNQGTMVTMIIPYQNVENT